MCVGNCIVNFSPAQLTIPPGGYILKFMKHSHAHQHKSSHMTPAAKTQVLRRLKIIEGQVRGLQEMVATDKYCIDVITQSSAIKQALSNIEDILLQNHLDSCVVKQIHEGETKKPIDEILKVYKLKRK